MLEDDTRKAELARPLEEAYSIIRYGNSKQVSVLSDLKINVIFICLVQGGNEAQNGRMGCFVTIFLSFKSGLAGKRRIPQSRVANSKIIRKLSANQIIKKQTTL